MAAFFCVLAVVALAGTLAGSAATTATAPPALPPASSAVVTVAGLRYRVQALSASVVRLEAESARGGFEDRPTFFAANRSWAGIALAAKPTGPNSTTITTSAWSLELAAAAPAAASGLATSGPAAAAATTCTDPMAAFSLSGVPALPS
eukprot:SAG22_NODE_1298_length_4811_cov_3.430178_4_plen_147_part_01